MAGSETTVHAAMREMVARGHTVNVIADRTPEDYEFEGVKVFSLPQNQFHHARVREIATGADILITHLDCTSLAMQLCLDMNRPLVHFVHNHAQLGFWRVPPHKAHLIVFNTHWIAMNETYKDEPWPGKSIIIHPVVEPEQYKCEPGTKITFVNPTVGKGVATVHKLAEAMPDYEFLIVEGIYGEQVAPPNLNEEWVANHPNIEHMRNSPDFRDVLRKTKVLLMPSNYESYGRCAVEACCAGIPVIVSPTQGLWEALGDGQRYPATETEYGVRGASVIAKETLPMGLFDEGYANGAGIFCRRIDDIPANADDQLREWMTQQNAIRLESWKSQIERLYNDEVYYRSRSDAALALADKLDPKADFDRLEDALLETYSDWKEAHEEKVITMWVSSKRYWETSDGSWVAEQNGRLPADAVRLAIGIGGEIPEKVAMAKGLIESKMVPGPVENKAEVPSDNKRKRKAA